MRVEICGGIASGKTTLARLLKGGGLAATFESFEENPFLKQFYLNPEKFAFETEIAFLLQHYHQIKASRASVLVCDFSLKLDRAYADVTLRREQQAAFTRLFNFVRRELGPPRLIIQLVCSADEELRRIRLRSRKVEMSIQISYLEALGNAIDRRVNKAGHSVHVLRLDSEHRNFVSDRQERRKVQKEVCDALRWHA